MNNSDCSDAWKFVACHCENDSYQIKGIDYDKYYSTVAHPIPLRTNIAIMDMHRLTARILDVSNALHNTDVTIYERVCISLPTYYLDRFETFYPNVTINGDDSPFCLQYMIGIQVTKSAGRHWNQLLDAVVTMMKNKKSMIQHAIYIKVLYDRIMSYIMVSTDDVLNTFYNETSFD